MPIATARLTGIRSRPFGYRTRREPLWSSRQAFFSEAAIFVLAAAGAYSLNVVGALPYSEVFLLLLLPVLLLVRGGRAFDRQYLMFYILAGGWFLGTQIADTYNGMPAYNRMKGTARVVFFILDFMALAILINNKSRRILVFAISLAALMFLTSFELRGRLRASVEIRVEPRLHDDGAADLLLLLQKTKIFDLLLHRFGHGSDQIFATASARSS